jgi:hypothetical protein
MNAIVSKTEFAARTGVTPTRVSQWIREGKIGSDALEGEGRFARIKVEVALQQIGARRDPGQALSNGLDTRLNSAPLDRETESDPLAAQLKAERLQQLRYANQRSAEEALIRRGVYVRADDTKAAMTRVAAKMLTVFEAALTEIVGQLAAETGHDRRALVHKARAAWREVRAKAAESARREATELAPLIEDHVPDASDVAAGEA